MKHWDLLINIQDLKDKLRILKEKQRQQQCKVLEELIDKYTEQLRKKEELFASQEKNFQRSIRGF